MYSTTAGRSANNNSSRAHDDQRVGQSRRAHPLGGDDMRMQQVSFIHSFILHSRHHFHFLLLLLTTYLGLSIHIIDLYSFVIYYYCRLQRNAAMSHLERGIRDMGVSDHAEVRHTLFSL